MSVVKRRRELTKLARSICPDALVEHTNGGHIAIIIKGPEGTRRVFVAGTAGDHRDLKNIKREVIGAARHVGILPPQ